MNDTKPRTRRFRGGALITISILFLGSAALRIGAQAETTQARDMPEVVQQMVETDRAPLRPDATAEGLQLLLSALQNREQQLNRREIQIVDRTKALEIANEAIELKLAALIEAEERLSSTLALADGASEGDLNQLTEVYQKMKPKDAAALFEEMAPDFAAGFLGRMRPDSAASIMAGLSPKAAYSISAILAGRNAWVPTE